MSKSKGVALLAGLPLMVISLSGYADGSGKWTNAEETYNKICAYCHEVGVGPLLKGRQFPAAVIEYIARNGNRAMPSFTASFIDDASLKALAEYIEKSPAPPDAPSASHDSESSETQVAHYEMHEHEFLSAHHQEQRKE